VRLPHGSLWEPYTSLSVAVVVPYSRQALSALLEQAKFCTSLHWRHHFDITEQSLHARTFSDVDPIHPGSQSCMLIART
jgi:hypothetical protein